MRKVQAEDMLEIKRWFSAHQQEFPEELCKCVGFIVPGIAAGFLMKTDTTIAIIEGYVSSPESRGEQRDRALEDITGMLLEEALVAGFKHVMCLTRTAAIEKRARSWGFSSEGEYMLLSREL